MKIFVTGANGQLGMSLRKICGEYPQHDFIFADRQDADVTDPDMVRRFAAESGAELMINCAAYTAVDRAEQEQEEAGRVNHEGARNMAAIARKCGIPLVHISTDYVFNGEAHNPITEEELPDPRCVYGMTKLAGEEAVRLSGCDAAVVRTSWLYSEFGHNFVRTMLRLAAAGQRLRVVDDQTGSPTYATDLARAIIGLAERGICGFEIYNYSNAGETTWCGFAKEICRQAGVEVDIEPLTTVEYPTAACRPAYSVLSTEKIRKIGVEIPEWRDALGRCLSEIRKQK